MALVNQGRGGDRRYAYPPPKPFRLSRKSPISLGSSRPLTKAFYYTNF